MRGLLLREEGRNGRVGREEGVGGVALSEQGHSDILITKTKT